MNILLLIFYLLFPPVAAQGFVTERPSQWGADVSTSLVDRATAERFVMPGTGTMEISEIGLYFKCSAVTLDYFKFGIFTDDAVNTCPDVIVANSLTAEQSTSDNTMQPHYVTYGTKPELTGGTVYWLAIIHKGVTLNFSRENDTNTNGYGLVCSTGITYDTGFPTATQWETHTDNNEKTSFWAVYASTEASTAKRLLLLGAGK